MCNFYCLTLDIAKIKLNFCPFYDLTKQDYDNEDIQLIMAITVQRITKSWLKLIDVIELIIFLGK